METQIAQFRYRRGNKKDLPTLAVGEPGLTLDTNELYVGATGGNIKLAQNVDVSKVKSQLEEMYFETAKGTGNAITLTISPQVLTSDFKGKVSGSTVLNGNIFKQDGITTLPSPSTPTLQELGQQYIDKVMNLDGSYHTNQRGTNGAISSQLFSFDIIRTLQDKYGDGIWQGKTALADKVAIARQVITNIVLTWYGFGSSSSGNKATFARWSNNSNSWVTAGTTTNDRVTFIQGKPSYIGVDLIDSNGFIHALAYADASNGTVSSVTNTDYVNIEVTSVSSPPNGYIRNFVASANNNGTATTINGIPVYNPGTTDTPVFVKDKAYTLYYSESRRCFYATASSDRFIKDGGNVATIQAGLRNARPSSLAGGGIYIATDTQETYSYDGTAWKVVGRSPYTTATETADGLMSKEDKKNLRLVQEGVTALNGITGTHTSQIVQAQTDINTNRTNAGNLTSLDQKIKDGGASSNLVSAINFTLNYLSLGDIKNLIPTQSPEGTTITLNWSNPTSTDFIKAEIFMSKTDITNFDYASCVANGNVTKVVDEKTTTKSMVVPQTGKYYFRAFATYNVYENIIQSKGITTNITTVDQVPPGAITNLVVKEDNATATLTWSNPSDVDLSGIKIMRKVGSYPANQNDGTVVLNTIATTLVDTGLTNGTTYYYRLFPFDVNGNYNTTPTGQQITATPDIFKIYGVKIEKGNSNPDTRVTYIEQAVGKTPAPIGGGNTLDLSYGSWKDTFPFNLIKPCLVTRTTNTVVKYLNPNNLDQDTTGAPIDTLKDTHNVMIEFPKIYFSLTSDTTHLYIRYSDKKVDSSYTCLAHLNGDVEKDKLYLGAYLNNNESGKYHSWSGYTKSGVPSTSLVDGLQTNEYFLQTYRHVVMLQALFVILYKSTDSQKSLGRGQLSPSNPTKKTGDTATKGMNFGSPSLSTEPVSFLGLEDFWGTNYTWIYGMTVDGGNGSKVYIDSGIRANTGTRILIGDVLSLTVNTAGYIDGTIGNGNAIFFPNKMTGSSSTYYCDSVRINAIGTSIAPVALASREGSGDSAGIFSIESGGFGTTYGATRLALFL